MCCVICLHKASASRYLYGIRALLSKGVLILVRNSCKFDFALLQTTDEEAEKRRFSLTEAHGFEGSDPKVLGKAI